MRKLRLILLITLCLVLALTGCSQNTPANSNTTNEQQENDTTSQDNNNSTAQTDNSSESSQDSNNLTTPLSNTTSSENQITSSQDNSTENKFDSLTLEERMERVLNDANQYSWGFDDGILSAKDSYIFALVLRGFSNGDVKTYINETYIYDIPSSLDFNIEKISLNGGGYSLEFNGETYAFLYNNIFDENIEAQDTVEVWPFDPPLVDTTLNSIDEIYENIYRITGSYDG